MRTIKPTEWKVNGGRLIDVRNLDEFAGERLDGFECVPLDRLLSTASKWDPGEKLVLTCKSGMRARQAAQRLQQAGFSQVSVIDGGIDACRRDGLTVITERRPMPVQRQVMIWAGLLLLTGLGLSIISPWFLLIDGFVAVMLTSAGLTGFCPAARILQLMPWNAASSSTCGTCQAEGTP
jgi:rhodanese-related sulfurtransferase